MNYMEQVAEMLGVAFGEEFEIEGMEYKYKIMEGGVYYLRLDMRVWIKAPVVLNDILAGNCKVNRLPFYPKYGTIYYTYSCGWGAIKTTWEDEYADYVNRKIRAVFRTKKEAEEKRPEIYKNLTGKDWKDRD